MALFQNSVLKDHLRLQDEQQVDAAYQKFTAFFHNPEIQENIRSSKEEQFQATFLNELFVKVLDYTMNPQPGYELTTEFKNQKNARKADGAILKDGLAIGVIELKGTNTKHLEGIRQQAFDYKTNQKGCVYVITSNFEKLRLYINDATEFLEFDLFELNREDFSLLYLCLHKDNIFSNRPLKIKEASIVEEEVITKQFYKDYSVFKRELFRDLVLRNVDRIKKERPPGYESDAQKFEADTKKQIRLSLFKKSQKLIDRFLFIFFAEDRGLLPPNSIHKILADWNKLKDLDAVMPLYDRFKLYFSFLDTGRKGTDKKAEIFAYNGGLFKPDPILDMIEIDDELLYKHTSRLATYDFESQVDVNILGHIFENSLNEIESVNAEIEGADFDKQKSKRKKDGVFYTPKYITKYIVENTVGRLCEEKKSELGFREEEYYRGRKQRQTKTVKALIQILDDYREWLLKLTICDPACGSGAFLNQALDFLIREHQYIDEMKAKLLGGGLIFSDIETTILENNIYGVDINEESVEIAKLSLWLRTAQPRRKLNDLSSNIKCGNSLIDDKKFAGNKAFIWEQEFPEVFANGGFDVVIGNPPYGATLNGAKYLKEKYYSFSLSGESYILFTELAVNLIKVDGRLGFIIPDTYLNLDFSSPLRKFLLRNSEVENIVLLPANIFETATVDTTNLILRKKKEVTNFHKSDVRINLVHKKSKVIEFDKTNREFFVSSETWFNEGSFLIRSNHKELEVLQKLDSLAVRIETVTELYSGIKAYEVGKGNPKQTPEIRTEKPFTSNIPQGSKWKPFFEGKHVERYGLNWSDDSWILYGEWLAAPRNPEQFKDEKILIRKIISQRLIATYVPYTSYCNTLLFVLKLRPDKGYNYFALLGILNSSLMAWYFRHKFQISDDDTFPQIMIRDIQQFPLPNEELAKFLNDDVKKFLALREKSTSTQLKFQAYFSKILHLNTFSKKLQTWHELEFGDFIKELNKAIKASNKEREKEAAIMAGEGGASSRAVEVPTLTKKDEFEWMELFEENKQKALELQREIEKTDNEIDKMVYELYGLTEEEIAIVEGS